jgi:ribosome biogenesis GTPase
MSRPADKPPRKKQQTHELLSGEGGDEEDAFRRQFGNRERGVARQKMAQTALLRAGSPAAEEIDGLPIGQVTQVFSRYCQVRDGSGDRLCVVRKTVTKLADTRIVVGDLVRFRDGKPGSEPVVEQLLPRKTILTRADGDRGDQQHPIVANAEQMLIVASIREPVVKWGLIDRMIVAARCGGLEPILCLNKMDLADKSDELDYYASLGIRVCQTSVTAKTGLETLAAMLKDKSTVLAGHSGVGKSSLIGAIEPGLDISIGEVSEYTDKGRHTTTSARRYDLTIGGCVIDTPGVKLFGLWNVSRDNLKEYFPDVAAGTAPAWRVESYQRIAESLAVN